MDGLPSSPAIMVARHPSVEQISQGILLRDFLLEVPHQMMMFPCMVYTSDTK